MPLSIGGAPRDPRNLWPEPRNGPNNAEQKDQLETWAARMACAGRIPLGRLQHEMASDWTALYRARRRRARPTQLPARRLKPHRSQIVPPMRETGLEPVAKGL